MKLPKKYEGVTPGEWAVRGIDQSMGCIETRDGKYQIGQAGQIHGDDWKTEHAERKANATIMADAPRLAAAVVKFREDMEHIIEYWNRDQNEMAMADALNHIIETAEQSLEDSKEWEA